MPSFSFLRRRRISSEGQNDPPTDHVGDAIGDKTITKEKVQARRRQSKRAIFRSLLTGGTPRSESQASTRSQAKSPEQPSSPNKPMPDSNKPLPSPPGPATAAAEQPAKETKELHRIISPITLPDLHKLFSGAPQFFVRSEGSHTGAPNPSVAFPWNNELEIRDLSDHGQIEDQAWSGVTAKQHITRDFSSTKEAERLRHEKLRAHYAPKVHERPNMLSMQGLERGTLGFAAALELGVADALKEEDELPGSPGMESLSERREHFLKAKQGVRPIDKSALILRLIDISAKDNNTWISINSTASFAVKSSVDLYTELFTQILYPPVRVTDTNDPYSIHVQIEALIDVLAAPRVWIDFSLVEWRIRLGQILWSEPYEPETSEQEVSINGETVSNPQSQQFWLLLQILLSCELLVRLDIVTKKAEKDPDIITAEEVRRFERDATPAVRWSMILARVWLENIYIDETKLITEPEEQKPTGWLASLTGAASAPIVNTQVKLDPTSLKVKHPIRQASGLLHFARKLHWPQIEPLEAKFSQMKPTSDGTSNTPDVETPFSMTTQRSSYFGKPTKPVFRRELSKQKTRAAVFRPEGWLSKSYLSGLMLPGEGLSHFLIATLLENDENAVARLGEDANLYGGFVYKTKSFWSTACVVGRVLAAGKGASECMGWMSCDVIPKGMGDGWVNVEVDLEPALGEDIKSPESARIWQKHEVEKAGHVLGDGDASTLLPGDFTLPPPDIKDSEDLEVKLESLELFASIDSVQEEAATDDNTTTITDASEAYGIKNYAAMMKFSVKYTHGIKEMDFALEHDVHFVTAHPCIPSKNTKLLHSPISPSSKLPPPTEAGTEIGPHQLYAGHPLHKSFTYKREVFSHILIPSLINKDSLSHIPLQSLHTDCTEVFVIDCTEPTPPPTTPLVRPTDPSATKNAVNGVVHVTRKRKFGSDLEMMARAWCAEKGYNALISRKGRNCIACSIREARALGWKVVLRFG